jgi:hypothetical protein
LRNSRIFYIKNRAKGFEYRILLLFVLILTTKKNFSKDNELLKFQIGFKSASFSIQEQVMFVFNQFIDNLKLPVNKFTSIKTSGNTNLTDINIFKSNHHYTVTYNNNKSGFNFDHDDDYIDFEEFERWSIENEKKHKIPKLK